MCTLIPFSQNTTQKQEFVTGWFRREDRERVRLECPLGLIPLGRHNALDASMHGHSEETVDRVGTATMAVVKGTTRDVDTVTVRSETGQVCVRVRKSQTEFCSFERFLWFELTFLAFLFAVCGQKSGICVYPS